MDTSGQYKQHSSLLPKPAGMQNLPEGLLEAVQKAAKITPLEAKLSTRDQILNKIEELCMQWQNKAENKQQLAYAAQLASTTTGFTDTMAALNTEKNNQVASLQQEIEHLRREAAAPTLEIPPQSHTASSEAYTPAETVPHNGNPHRGYIKPSNLSEPLSFSSD
ncbi:hypothetical protein EMPG_11105 [Blastomyces silverae]|uniref:Uncharacterized protein n=1 Tax=Blastomyces silverae TaxID=2060906 RepID=A0A0H1B851_9EURO|nr:hypothetical protein EMPG_11105 [Blastomyces silverae]